MQKSEVFEQLFDIIGSEKMSSHAMIDGMWATYLNYGHKIASKLQNTSPYF